MTRQSLVVDLNADLGESFGTWRLGDDEAMLAIVTSANVACGFHAGDPLTMRRACAHAVARRVAIGAQVSYRDLAGFGRREMTVPADELSAEILYQIAALDGIARAEGGRVSYVKPHGALYNRAARDPGPVRRALTGCRTRRVPRRVARLLAGDPHGQRRRSDRARTDVVSARLRYRSYPALPRLRCRDRRYPMRGCGHRRCGLHRLLCDDGSFGWLEPDYRGDCQH